jgi:hypothetical protein
VAAQRTASSSHVQKKVEDYVLRRLSEELQVQIAGGKLSTGKSYIELDGMWLSEADSKAVVVEVFAHLGRVKAAQRHKVQTDVFKLSLARQILLSQGIADVRAIVAFVCEDCSKAVTGRTWVADAALQLGVDPQIVPIREDLRQELIAAQKEQNLLEPS